MREELLLKLHNHENIKFDESFEIATEISSLLNNKSDIPLGQRPYLCKSAEIEVTPGKRKSNNGVSVIPALS